MRHDGTKLQFCSFCGKEFYTKQYQIDRCTNLHCSKECFYEHKKELVKGPLNHQWGLKGELNSSFKGDIRVGTAGYILIRDSNHPFGSISDYVLLHRKVVEEWLRQENPDSIHLVDVVGFDGKYLSPDVVIHHKDQNKFNNHIENLEIMDLGDHSAMHNSENVCPRDKLTGQFLPARFKKLSHNGSIKNTLVKKHLSDAGLDICASEDGYIRPKQRGEVKTSISVAVPEGCVGIVWSRSGLSVKHGIEVGAGCVDSSYRGELIVVLYNHSNEIFMYKAGDRIAQFLTIPVYLGLYKPVEELDETSRGECGFGSTGV